MNTLVSYLEFCTPLNWAVWGLGPIFVADLTLLCGIALFEKVAQNSEASLIQYGRKTRAECQEATYSKISKTQQYFDVGMTIFGPTAIINGVMNAILSSYFFPVSEQTPMLPSLSEFCVHFILLIIVGDFALYWGHRIQHVSKFLWDNCHSYHHKIDTPSALSTASIESVDGTLQGGAPILFAGILLSPHPVTYYVYISVRLLDNVMNHCGVRTGALERGECCGGDSAVFRAVARALVLLTFKGAAPIRAGVEHHDYHHKYSNYTQNAKNFGEYFTVWDHLFGTFSKASGVASKRRSQ
jgi:sterol desaturase/sphingolipid hydroxylase (fatty acid hydroxylase superfamily)